MAQRDFKRPRLSPWSKLPGADERFHPADFEHVSLEEIAERAYVWRETSKVWTRPPLVPVS